MVRLPGILPGAPHHPGAALRRPGALRDRGRLSEIRHWPIFPRWNTRMDSRFPTVSRWFWNTLKAGASATDNFSETAGDATSISTDYTGHPGCLRLELGRRNGRLSEGTAIARTGFRKGQGCLSLKAPPHMKNWLECLRTRKEPNAPIAAGYAHAVAGILADLANRKGRKMRFDEVKREIREA